MVPRIKKYSGHCKRQSWGNGGGEESPHFLPQMEFLTAFLDHTVTKSFKVTRTATKIDYQSHQIIRNRIANVPVFKIFRGHSAQTPLDGSRLSFSTMGSHSKLHSVVTALADLKCHMQ